MKFFTFVGLPKSVQSDQGSNFMSGIFQQVVHELDVKQYRSSAYHPKNQGVFNVPVNPDHCPNYMSIIQRPMDLGTVRKNVVDGQYTLLSMYHRDVSLVFGNATLYNSEKHHVHKSAVFLREMFTNEYEKLLRKYDELRTKPSDMLRNIMRQRRNFLNSSHHGRGDRIPKVLAGVGGSRRVRSGGGSRRVGGPRSGGGAAATAAPASSLSSLSIKPPTNMDW